MDALPQAAVSDLAYISGESRQATGVHHHAVADACHIEVIRRHASPHLDPHLFSDHASLVRNTGGALGGHLVGRGTSKRWSGGKDGATKTEASDRYVLLHSLLASHLRVWHQRTPYGENTDFVFPSLKAHRVSPYPLLFLRLSISARQQKQREFLSKTVKGSAFIICVTHLATGL
jgi:hypothetical protein